MNLKIDTTNWQEFRVGDIFVCGSTKPYKLEELENGKIPYITRSAFNNGCSGNKYADEYVNVNKGKCITIGAEGKIAFYQPNDFISGTNIYTLKSKYLNSNTSLFICCVLNKNSYKYAYGRARTLTKIKNEIIKLPVLLDNTPDWQFMENYIKAIVNKKRSNGLSLKEYIKTNNKHKELPLNTELWKMFKLSKLFDNIYKAKANKKNSIETFNKNNLNLIPLVTRTDKNNGCDCYINKDDAIKIEKGNAIIIGDTTSTIYYQQNDFATGDHIVICRSSWMNKYNALFIRSILEKERFRYNYGRAFKMERIKEMSIKLPQTADGTPDWQFMENYIKSLPYGDKI